LISGFAYDAGGKIHASMGVDCGDIDNDGQLDFHVTSFQEELATLYRNLGAGFLEDVTVVSGAGAGTRAPVTWGNILADFDNDGDRDIFIACGHLNDQLEKYDRSSEYRATNVLLENFGPGRFRDVSAEAGPGLQVRGSSRGAAADDLDGDGDLDLVVLNSRELPTVLRNDSTPSGHWLQIECRGRRANRDAVGARVEVVAGDLKLIDEVHSGRSYQSHFGTRLQFGLGPHTRVDRLQVTWPGGKQQVLRDVSVDQRLTIVEQE
jgi:hypothetical protein